MSESVPVYSIQQTYIIKPVSKSEKRILTCDERIDVPTIDPLSQVKTVLSPDQPATFVPCIELAGEFLSEFNLTFETNEGVTVLPIKIASGQDDPLGNPYRHFRYVLALPSGATGVKSCKLIEKHTGEEVQHNLTFGIMPPPYNYDNALHGVTAAKISELEPLIQKNTLDINELKHENATVFSKRANDVNDCLVVPSVNTKSPILGWYLELYTGSTLKVEFNSGPISDIIIDETDISTYNRIFLTFDRITGVVSLYGILTMHSTPRLLNSGVITPFEYAEGIFIITKDGIDSESNIRTGFVTLVDKFKEIT